MLVLAVAGCGDSRGDDDGIDVVAGFYPLAEVATRVGGDRVSVTNLTPPGTEPHDLELSPDHLDEIDGAEVVVFVGGGFQPAVEDVADRADVAVDVLVDDATADPHVWLDPRRMVAIVEAVRDALVEVDPEGAEDHRAGADAFVAELEQLDQDLADGLAVCDRRTIVTAHDAFGRLAERYDLEHHAISGLAPESEPDPARLSDLTDLVEREGVTTIFAETLVPEDVAETLAREAGVEVAVLDPIEGLSEDQLAAGERYGTVMRANLAVLREALGCR